MTKKICKNSNSHCYPHDGVITSIVCITIQSRWSYVGNPAERQQLQKMRGVELFKVFEGIFEYMSFLCIILIYSLLMCLDRKIQSG